MADYKQMYLTLLDATEKAMAILIESQKKCEEIYISSEQPNDEHPKAQIIELISQDKKTPKL